MNEKIIKYIKICLIVVCLEVILFNITSFRTLFGKYNVKIIEKENIEYLETVEGKARYKIDNIKVPVATIRLELLPVNLGVLEYNYEYSDKTTSGYMSMPSKSYVPEDLNTHYIPCYLSGEVNYIIINIDEVVEKANLMDCIVINEKIPFNFNFVRVMVLILLIIVIDLLKNSSTINSIYEQSNLKQEFVLLTVLGVFAILITFINIKANDYESLDMYNKDLVKALYNHQISLLQEPSDEFKELENPYDVMKRGEPPIVRGRDYIWDAAYYNEKFYVYFGILPVLVFFLPFYVLTGEYLQCATVCLIISIALLILLKEILCKLYNRYFTNLPFKLLLYSLIILYAGSTIFYMNGAARFYEVPILSSVCCVLLGIYFILRKLEEPEKKYRYIFLSCLFMALSVACRPTHVLSSLLIVPILWKEFVDGIKENKKSLFKCIVVIAIPYLLVAIPLMWYNYVRFENILEFGANYQLTINNIGALENRIFAIPIGLLCNLFCIPDFMPEFPFVRNQNEFATFYGFYYIENMIAGVFMLAPICFACFGVHKIHKKTENKELKNWIYILIITGILIAAISAAKAGSIGRYLFDYAWMFVLAGLLIFTTIYQSLKTEETKKVFLKILCILMVYIVVINILAGIVSEKSFFQVFSTELFYKIKYSICFWQ